jgi:hypothetical protein
MTHYCLKSLFLIVLLFVFSTEACQQSKSPQWTEKQLRAIWFPIKSFVPLWESVSVQGHWKQIRFGRITRIPQLNAVAIACSKLDSVCVESRAELDSPLDADSFGEHLRLGVVLPEEYAIHSWADDGSIVAGYKTDSADWELSISIKDKTAEKTYRETQARGSKTADPQIVHTWILE